MPPSAAARRNRRGQARKSLPIHVSVFNSTPEPWEASERDWAELPADAILHVFHKLGHVELLLGGVAGVCRSWHRAAREEPELWRHIDVRCLPAVPPIENLTRAALRLSAGQCQTFVSDRFEEDLFTDLAESGLSLKSLKLIHFSGGYPFGTFPKAIKKFALLEDFTLVNGWFDRFHEKGFELVPKACQRLKHFKIVNQICHSYITNRRTNNRKAFTIASMHGLCSLKLVGQDLGNEGLAAIIDNCPDLKYLNIRDCWNIRMDGNLKQKCAQITMDYYEYFPPYEACCCSCCDPSQNSYSDDDSDPDDFEEHERILDIKSMRRSLLKKRACLGT